MKGAGTEVDDVILRSIMPAILFSLSLLFSFVSLLFSFFLFPAFVHFCFILSYTLLVMAKSAQFWQTWKNNCVASEDRSS